EQPNSAFLSGHRIHDNVIVNQHGDGILVGYYVTGENWITNNLIVRAGLGPEWPDDSSSHTGLRIDSGHEALPGTVLHVHHNTIYGCGWSGAVLQDENGHILISAPALQRGTTVDFRNNIVVSTGEPLLAPESGAVPAGDYRNCWSGGGGAPAWDRLALSSAPGFVDAAASNFQLVPSSACVDAAVAVVAPASRDLLGVPRPQGQASDLGAYEFVSGGGGASCTLTCSASAPATGRAGEVLAFTATATPSDCGGGSPAAAWTFGDGGTAAGLSAARAYAAPGPSPWSMTASSAGVTCTRSGTLTITAAPAPGAFVYTIPAVTHAPGSAGAIFRTDVAAVSLSDAAASLTLTFERSGGGSLARTAAISARGAREFADILVGLFGHAPDASVFGALQIASDVPLVVSSRTYNQTVAGTLGGFLPGVAATQGLAPGKTGILPQLRKSAAFRTNIAVVNLGASSVTARIQLRDGSGAPLGTARTLQAAPFGLIQENDIFLAAGAGEPAVAYATVEVLTAGGRVFAFASVIDNATNDPTLVPLVIPEG
ncbi:MAG: PKD domain-containing protein, partial [Thermoanaerobaculia bacterium]|nr:PKD domain-containing protein [Thermoanaerobaculia bacterium]